MPSDTTATQPIQRFPPCCRMGSENIRWHGADLSMGNEKDGWCLTLGERGHGDISLFRENVKFCPWCGKELPP